MATSLDQLLYGIRKIESGGRYGIVNSIGAVGAYQVMKGNIPKWTRQALGYSMTWQQFRDSPAAQDAVARYKLNSYMKKYGSAEAAAAMWFSGQPNPHSQRSDGYNTVEQYVGKAIAASGGGSISAGGGSTYSVEAAVPQLTDSERAEQFGFSMRLINSSKELKKLFQRAVREDWSGQTGALRFAAAVKNTKWWRTQSDTLRKYVTLKVTDPATWKQQVSAAGATVRSLAIQVGVDPSLLTKNGHWTSFFSDVVYKKTALGWSDARLKDYLGLQVHSHGDIMYGEAGENFDKLHEVAYANGMRYSTSWYAQQAASIVGGRSTLEQSQATIRRQAAAKYSAFAEQIKAGMNAMDLAAPYIKAASDLLETPETDVDLFNPHVAKAMTAKAAPGAQGSAMPLWQFENEVRSDPLWRKTNNARESMFGVAHQVARDFGLVF